MAKKAQRQQRREVIQKQAELLKECRRGRARGSTDLEPIAESDDEQVFLDLGVMASSSDESLCSTYSRASSRASTAIG